MCQKLLCLCICFCLFQSCDKEQLSPLSELENNLPTTFEVSINATECINGGTLLSARMPNPELYNYLWEVNGKHGGHHSQTKGCQCIKEATVRVMRLADGLSVNNAIQLTSSCASSEVSL